jgi:Protein of unknown function (DUF4232)
VRVRWLAVTGLLGIVGALGVQATVQAATGSPGTARARLAAAARLPVCMPQQLRLGSGGKVSEKTQQETRIVVLTNVSRQRCGLEGYPLVTLESAHGTILPFKYRDHGDQMLTSARPRLVVLAPGGHAYLGINKSSCVARSTATASSLTLWGLGQLTVRLNQRLDYCGAGDPGHMVDVSPIEPSGRAALAP